MYQAIVITPVKNSISTSLETIKAINGGAIRVKHLVYNDFSTNETQKVLEANLDTYGFELVNLAAITQTPSPNYDLVLQDGQKRALQAGLPLIVVESDVCVQSDTLNKMIEYAAQQENLGLVGAITVDKSGKINFPYLKFKNSKEDTIDTKRSLSFCCTLMSNGFLSKYDFKDLDASKDWYDTTISEKSIELGFKNVVLKNLPVLHQPHGSRPWKQLKYSNPLKYYWLKFTKGRDKI